ncbi:MAG: endonuclease III [Candidatus Sungbacteria bacterium]|nr:endonuclease III [Candidatus Sungbacteria bacterium]
MGEYNQFTKRWIKKETLGTKRKRAVLIVKALLKLNPATKTALHYKTPMQFLAAVIMSAQATDIMVNKINEEVFKKYKTPKDYANANLKIFEKEISKIGLYKAKARNIIAAAKLIQEKFKGQIPKTMTETLTLPGVGRKTASIVLWNVHGIVDGIAVDTHTRRLAQRLGLTIHDEPAKIEKDLMELYKNHKTWWPKITTLFIDLGRPICKAPTPKCGVCPLRTVCPSARV